jgi:hypothetical protein
MAQPNLEPHQVLARSSQLRLFELTQGELTVVSIRTRLNELFAPEPHPGIGYRWVCPRTQQLHPENNDDIKDDRPRRLDRPQIIAAGSETARHNEPISC